MPFLPAGMAPPSPAPVLDTATSPVLQALYDLSPVGANALTAELLARGHAEVAANLAAELHRVQTYVDRREIQLAGAAPTMVFALRGNFV
jgi:hypothetical protein